MHKHNPDDHWKSAAMTHDSLVVHLLLRLKHSATRPYRGKLLADLSPAGWGAKQPRSGSTSASASKSVSDCRRIIGRSRCSPSTPLSWSGGSGSGSGGGVLMGGCDTWSLPHNQSLTTRSTINLAGTEVNGACSSKHRKKKTYAELKVEEDMLLKEQMHLNQELAMLGALVKEHRAENETLKRIKVNVNTQSMKNNSCNATGTSGLWAASSKEAVVKRDKPDHVSLTMKPARQTPSSTWCHAESDVVPGKKRSNLMLPDLNMMPSELESTN